MFFSVIVPLYNKEAYIEKTIASLLEQTFQDYELILIDDGSTDGSFHKASSFSDERIRIFRQKNGGVSKARNTGIAKARGNYIAFLDADDWWDREYLSRMKDMILKYPDYKVFGCCSCEVLPTGKQRVNPIRKQLESEITVLDYDAAFLQSIESPLHTSATIVKADLIDSFGNDDIGKRPFTEGIATGEDILLWLRLTAENPVVMLREVLSYYNRRDLNSTTNRTVALGENFTSVLSSELRLYANSLSADSMTGSPGKNMSPFFERLSPGRARNRRKLITRLILSRMKRYYLFDYSEEVKTILDPCDLKDATISQRIFYSLPKSIGRLAYNALKGRPRNRE